MSDSSPCNTNHKTSSLCLSCLPSTVSTLCQMSPHYSRDILSSLCFSLFFILHLPRLILRSRTLCTQHLNHHPKRVLRHNTWIFALSTKIIRDVTKSMEQSPLKAYSQRVFREISCFFGNQILLACSQEQPLDLVLFCGGQWYR